MVARNFERAAGNLTALNPYTGQTDRIAQFLADPVEMSMLHMVTADPARTPSLTLFALPDYFLFAGAANCTSPCVAVNPNFAWNHGDVQPDIITTWLGMAGPGVRAEGVDSDTWSDHTDIRPTIMMLTGLQDDYVHDGRALTEPLYNWAIPQALRAHNATVARMSRVFKQINASVGQLGLDTLSVSTRALRSGTPSDDHTYAALEALLGGFTTERNSLAAQISSMLDAATFHNHAVNEQRARLVTAEAEALLLAAHVAAR